MAATGKTPILLYGSTTATNQPSAGNLTNSSDGCEIAINVADKNLFFKDSTNTVNTVPIRQSSTSSNGWLSSTDWNTFNNKQPAGTYVTSVTGTAPVVSSGGTTPAISMAAATGSVNGYLTSTDWTTFNGKQAALVSGTNIKTVSGTSLLGSGDLGTIGVGYGGTGKTSWTANGVLYASATNTLANGSAFTFDGTNVASTGVFTSTNSVGFQMTYAGNQDIRWAIPGVADWRLRGNYSTGNIDLNLVSGVGNTISVGLNGYLYAYQNIQMQSASGGIYFNSGSSSLLNDYETGTWTPTITPASGTITASNQGSHYVKVGALVMASGYLNVSSVSSPSGAITIGGLPYTNGTSYVSCVFTTFGGGVTSSQNGYINLSATTIVSVNFNANTIGAGANILFTAVYSVL